jgi:hypothetical protein
LEKNSNLKELLLKIKIKVGKQINFEIIRNKYEMDETDNIKSPNSCWFVLQAAKIDSKMNRYKLNPGEIIKIGRIAMRIRDIIFANKKLNKKLNKSLNESFGTNINIKDIQALKTDGNPFNTNGNENENHKNLDNYMIKKTVTKKSQKDIFMKIEKKNQICRICYIKEESEDDPLVKPCICSGSLKYIHLSCLKQWISTRSCIKIDNAEDCSIFLIKPVECELCKTKFPDYIKHEGILYPLLDFSKEFESYLTLESLTLDKEKNKFIYVVSLSKNKKLKLGRGHESNILLSDISVSRIHCYMIVENGKVFIADNKSKFGTLILVQTPSIKISDNLPLYIQVGRSFLKCKVKKTFKLFDCCEAEEKNNEYFYYNQNEKYIHDNLGMVVKPDISESDEEEKNNNNNNTFEEKYPLDVVEKYKVNNSMKLNEGDKMSDNEYLLLKHNQLNRVLKKNIIFTENIDDVKDKKKKKKKDNKEEDKKENDEQENNNNDNNEEEGRNEEESVINNGNDITANINNINYNGNNNISITLNSET